MRLGVFSGLPAVKRKRHAACTGRGHGKKQCGNAQQSEVAAIDDTAEKGSAVAARARTARSQQEVGRAIGKLAADAI